MARLSSENFRSPNTPQSTKASRFKNMLSLKKSRASLSPSSSHVSEKDSCHNDDNIPLGFKQVGLLPEERASLEGGIKAKDEMPRESLAEKEKYLNDTSMPINPDTRLDVLDATHADDVDKTPEGERTVKEKGSAKAAFEEKLAKLRKERLMSQEKGPETSVEHDRVLDNSEILKGKEQAKDSREGLEETTGIETVTHDASKVDSTTHYNKDNKETHRSPGPPSWFTFDELSENASVSTNPPLVAKIGPFKIIDERLASSTVVAVALLYLACIIPAALIGPKTFFVEIWRFAVLVGIYEWIEFAFGWKEEGTYDVMTHPVKCWMEKLGGLGRSIAVRMVVFAMSILVALLRGLEARTEA